MDRDERELFGTTLADLTSRSTGAELDAALESLGWAEALADDPEAAVGLLFEHQGAANATSSALDTVIAGKPGIAVVLPLGSVSVGTAYLSRAETALVGDEVVDVSSLDLRPVEGLDPSLGLVEVLGVSTVELAPAALAAGQRALAHELVGASRTMLQLARDHAVDRVQFGVPIASFQAVRHRLAESLVAVEAGAAAADAAWLDPTPVSAALAKAIAGRNATTVARHAQQVLAGIGFTTEHDFHHHLRRTLVLDRLLGDSRTLTRDLGRDLLAARRLPPLLPL
jgi:hypothetical protein